MNNEILIILGMVLTLSIFAYVPVFAFPSNAGTQYFQPGWDDFNQKFGIDSYVVYWNDDSGFHIGYHLTGLAPNTLYPLGFQLVLDSTSQCVHMFGNIPASNCSVVTRQGVTSAYESFELGGGIYTDSNGNMGDGWFNLGQVKPNVDYRMEFFVRTPNDNNCPNCSVIFQAPSPFGNYTVVRTPEFPTMMIVLVIALIPIVIFSRKISKSKVS